MNTIVKIAVTMLTLAAASVSHAQELAGEGATQGYAARVRIAPCVADARLLCGAITWLWEPVDDSGAPMTDHNNPSPELRKRPLVGLSMLNDFRMRDAMHWRDGRVYDPESGRTYKASLTLKSSDILEVEGCVLFVCRKQVWRRAQSGCSGAQE